MVIVEFVLCCYLVGVFCFFMQLILVFYYLDVYIDSLVFVYMYD